MAYRQRPGMAKPRESEPERVTPVPETYKGVNFPYRGTNKHGVEVPEDAQYDTREFQFDMPEQEDMPDYVEAEEEPTPVPVRIVEGSAREREMWRTHRAYAPSQRPVRLIGRNDRRKSVFIRNRGSNPGNLIIGSDNTVKEYTGYVMGLSSDLTIYGTEEIWGMGDASGDIDVMMIEYYSVEL